ncbi:MAG: metalloregulator ArsR/SmtB family transcription factor [Proteobacteria bacterium]|nr:metalloregulator ArsR/SmtB family transcription factor [Pseudomonadota bacterium]
MESKTAVTALSALAQESRLSVFRLLVRHGPGGLTAGAIAEQLALPAPTLSFHLKTLAQAGLVSMAQEGRYVRYRAAMAGINALLAFLTEDCCHGHPELCLPKDRSMPALPVFNILVLCTGNSARSILGEALFNHLGNQSRPGRVRALPEARSKSWTEFATPEAPRLDFIFTVCASAAGEACPVWPGHPATAHWAIPDPAHVEPRAARRAAFETAYAQLVRRISAFLALPLERMPAAEVQAAARRIHAEEGGQ